MTVGSSLLSALRPVIAAFESLKIEYAVGGSVGAAAHGVSRATMDIDLVAAIQDEHIDPLVEALGEAFYIEADMIRSAIQHESTFNLIHLKTMFKIDIFILKKSPFEQAAFARRKKEKIISDEYYVTAAEDLILHKLDWFRKGGGVSERQIQDVVGIMKVKAKSLDWKYLDQWAASLNLLGLLSAAKNKSGE